MATIAGYAAESELQILGDATVALGVLDMVFSTPEWIHRRTETIAFVTDTHRRRRVSLDLTIPKPCPGKVTWMDGNAVYLVPVDVLSKQALRGFDSEDERGQPFPILTRRQNGEIAWHGMVAYANEVLGQQAHPPLDDQACELLRRVTQEPGDVAERYVQLFEAMARRRTDAQLLLDDDGFTTAARMLARNFLLIGAVDGVEGARRILKFSYEEPHSSEDRRGRKQRLAESLGWTPTTIEVRVPGFSDCESYHFESIAPDGIEFVDIVLGDEARVSAEGHVDPKWAVGYSRLVGESPHRAHLAVSRTANSSTSPDEFIQPTINLTLQIARTGWLRAAAMMSLLVAGLMTVSLPFVVNLDANGRRCTVPRFFSWLRPWLCHAPETADLNTDPAALMVALVGAVSVVVLRSGEHAYTANRVRPLRNAAFASAFIPLAGAWLLAFQGAGAILTDGWWALVVVAWLTFGLLAVARRRGAR